MSNSYYEKGAVHNDHHKELHIDNLNGGDISKLISAFFKDDAEEAIVVDEEKSADTSKLSARRQNILDQLLELVDKGDWKHDYLGDRIKEMLKTVLGLGEVLSAKKVEVSEMLWHMLESGRGDRVKIVWQNMIGYLDDKGLFKLKGSPALNRDFFGDEDGYSNIDKGRPSRGNMSLGFGSVLPLLDEYCPKQ